MILPPSLLLPSSSSSSSSTPGGGRGGRSSLLLVAAAVPKKRVGLPAAAAQSGLSPLFGVDRGCSPFLPDGCWWRWYWCLAKEDGTQSYATTYNSVPKAASGPLSLFEAGYGCGGKEGENLSLSSAAYYPILYYASCVSVCTWWWDIVLESLSSSSLIAISKFAIMRPMCLSA